MPFVANKKTSGPSRYECYWLTNGLKNKAETGLAAGSSSRLGFAMAIAPFGCLRSAEEQLLANADAGKRFAINMSKKIRGNCCGNWKSNC